MKTKSTIIVAIAVLSALPVITFAAEKGAVNLLTPDHSMKSPADIEREKIKEAADAARPSDTVNSLTPDHSMKSPADIEREKSKEAADAARPSDTVNLLTPDHGMKNPDHEKK
jgi:hypothetical protein